MYFFRYSFSVVGSWSLLWSGHIQTCAVINWSNISWYYWQCWKYSSRTWIKLWTYKSRPVSHPHHELWGIYCEDLEKIKCVTTTLHSIWVGSWNCGCLVTWFCYQLIAKPGNKTATVSWPDPYEYIVYEVLLISSLQRNAWMLFNNFIIVMS